MKIAAAGATIFAIGGMMLVLQPEPEQPVAEAQADIFGFEFAERTDQQKFVETLMQEGMEEPRAYDHNGNKMFFSTTVTDESPRQVLERFQRGFVENGLNDKVHLDVPYRGEVFPGVDQVKDGGLPEAQRQWKIAQSRMDFKNDYIGGIVPMIIERDRMVMTGMSTNNDAGDIDGWVDELLAISEGSPRDMDLSESVTAMRYVDAVREGKGSRITAVWSDEDYKLRKFADIADYGEDLNVDPEIPTCPGCTRLLQISGETEVDYTKTAYRSNGRSVEQMTAFYKDALAGRGWQLSETAEVMSAVERLGWKAPHEATLLQFSRGTEFITVMAYPNDDGSTGVMLGRSN